MPTERRQDPRHPASARVSGRQLSGEGQAGVVIADFRGSLVDIASGGVGAVTDVALESASTVRLEVEAPGLPGCIPTVAQVRWSRPMSDGRYQVGLEFLV